MTTAAWQQRLRAIAENRRRGASELVRDAVGCLLDAFPPPREIPPDDLRERLIAFRFGQAAMAPVLRFCSELLSIRAPDHHDSDAARAVLNEWKQLLDQGGAAFLEHLRQDDAFAEPAGLMSWSSTVNSGLRKLTALHGPGKAVVGQSLPGGEGEQTAEFLSTLDWKVRLVNDAGLRELAAASGLGCVILGCDGLDDAHFVNKIGSGELARMAHESNTPVELWTSELKLLPSGAVAELDLSAGEILPSGATEASLRQPLFGLGNLADVDVIRTETGAWTREQIQTKSAQLRLMIPGELRLAARERR